MLKVGIFGGTGYTGIELLRILSNHKGVSVEVVTSEQLSGRNLHDVLPFTQGVSKNLELTESDRGITSEMDLAFLALPHTVSMGLVPSLLSRGVKVIDLSADFRLKEGELYEEVYGSRHECPELLEKAVYGLCEMFREELRGADLVAVPGCFPTSMIIPLYPLLKEGVVETMGIIADCKTGVSGGGRAPKQELHYTEVEGGIRAYGFPVHRHSYEVEQVLSWCRGEEVSVTFIPHLVPMVRGILATIYVNLQAGTGEDDLRRIYSRYYGEEPFIRLYRAGQYPSTRFVSGTNFCDLGISYREEKGQAIILSAIDNLVKGAAGAAVQCMNISLGFEERESLTGAPLFP